MFWCEDIERGVYQLIPPHIQITRKSSRVSCDGSVRLRIGNEYEHRILKSIRSLVLLMVLPLPNVLDHICSTVELCTVAEWAVQSVREWYIVE